MNVTRVELPDGRLVTIEGGDAESTARFIMNHYLGQAPSASAAGTVEPLLLPSMSFGASANTQPQDATPSPYIKPLESQVLNIPGGGKIEPLLLPVMEFGPTVTKR